MSISTEAATTFVDVSNAIEVLRRYRVAYEAREKKRELQALPAVVARLRRM